MARACRFVFSWLLVAVARAAVAGEDVASFSAAGASSENAANGFDAAQAMTPGSGYWCSAGLQTGEQVVTWTGEVSGAVRAKGIKVQWAYAPGEVKVLAGDSDGNVVEAACWQTTGRSEPAFTQVIMFKRPVRISSLTLAMRSPKPWGYFGIAHTELLTEPYPFMLVSAGAASAEELCVVAKDSQIAAQPCLLAVAAADGREIWTMTTAGEIVSSTGACLATAGGQGSGDVHVLLSACGGRARCDSGHQATWSWDSDGQLRSVGLGGFCLRVTATGASLRGCEGDATETGVFSRVAVPEFDPRVAASARNAAILLEAAAKRQQALLSALEAQAVKCHLPPLLESTLPQAASLSASFALRSAEDGAATAVSYISRALGFQSEEIESLLSRSHALLNSLARKTPA